MRHVEVVVALAVVAAGCGKSQRGIPGEPKLRTSSVEIAKGERLFQKFCYQCHPEGAAGIGPALNDKPLPEIAIRTQIRAGVGAMPAFDHTWMTDPEVAAVAEYVQALRAAPQGGLVAEDAPARRPLERF